MARRERPPWWSWELEISPHACKRMVERGLTEVDLRLMLGEAQHIHPDVEPGRWTVLARLAGRPWEIIVEPDALRLHVVVITAYELD